MECLEGGLTERLDSEMFQGENDLPDDILGLLGAADQRVLRLRQENMTNLRAIQKIILFEEDRALALDEVLARVLAFYRRFVPYR